MNFKIAPLWWPVVLLLSPNLIPVLLVKYFAYVRNRRRVESVNMKRLDAATPLELPEADYMRLSVLVDWKSEEVYIGDAGVSYFIVTNFGSLLFDVGHGPENKALLTNAKNMGFSLDAAQGPYGGAGGRKKEGSYYTRSALPREAAEPDAENMLPSGQGLVWGVWRPN